MVWNETGKITSGVGKKDAVAAVGGAISARTGPLGELLELWQEPERSAFSS